MQFEPFKTTKTTPKAWRGIYYIASYSEQVKRMLRNAADSTRKNAECFAFALSSDFLPFFFHKYNKSISFF